MFYVVHECVKNPGKTFMGIFTICLLLFIVAQYSYTAIDKNVFPDAVKISVSPETSENERGIILLDAITHQMRFEMNSTFGWSANDILIASPYILDNRAYRQYGVYIATKTLIDIYSRYIAKLGSNDREDNNLFKARSSYFPLSPSRWGFPGVSESAESSYKKGLAELETYKNNLKNGKAMYNCKTDDLHIALTTVGDDQLLGYALGLLENFEEQPWYKIDNSIYETQGIALVVRDFLKAVYELYPQVSAKNNVENYRQAMFYLDKICTYNPYWISNQPFNSGAVIRSYLLNAKNRIDDIANSLRI